jgi:hypothetical protein
MSIVHLIKKSKSQKTSKKLKKNDEKYFLDCYFILINGIAL